MRWAAAGLLALMVAWSCAAKGSEMRPSIQQVKAEHEERLFKLAGVVSVGIGRDAGGREVIVIGLDHPRPETQARLPGELDGYPVRVEFIGTVRAQ